MIKVRSISMKRKFIRKFTLRMILEVGIFGVVANILLQMTFPEITVEHDESLYIQIFILPVITGMSIALFAVFMAIHNTNVLRRYEYSLHEGREKIFYGVFVVVMALLCAADAIFLVVKCLPFLDSALAYAVKDAQIKNETLSVRRMMIDDLNRKANTYNTCIYISAVLTWVIQMAIYIFGAVKLVKEYRDPPDYWSGKKRSKKK